MNKTHRSIWNEALGAWVAASELTSGRGKKSSSRVLAVAAVALTMTGLAAAGALDGGTVNSSNQIGYGLASQVTAPASQDAFAIGSGVVTSAADGITLGSQITNNAQSGVLIGNNYVALDAASIRSVVFVPDGLAVGGTGTVPAQPVTNSSDSFVYVSGRSVNSITNSPGAVAIGGSVLNATDGVALGSGSKTSATLAGLTAAYNPSGTAVGTAPVGELSIGNAAGAKRRITNVAAGGADTDAVNVSQLKATDTKVTNLSTTVNNALDGGGIKYFHANSTAPDSQAIGLDSVAIGPRAVAGKQNALAAGMGANAQGANSTALGVNSVAMGSGDLYVGSGAGVGGQASNNNNSGFGTEAGR